VLLKFLAARAGYALIRRQWAGLVFREAWLTTAWSWTARPKMAGASC